VDETVSAYSFLQYLPVHRVTFVKNAVERLKRYILGLIGCAKSERLIIALDP
jgi:hypothetical protein